MIWSHEGREGNRRPRRSYGRAFRIRIIENASVDFPLCLRDTPGGMLDSRVMDNRAATVVVTTLLALAIIGCRSNAPEQQEAPPASPPQPAVSPVTATPTVANAQVVGFVFEDKNKNGQFDGADVRLGSQTVLVTNPSATKRIQEVTTDASGNFGFAGLADGEYRVSLQVPASYRRTTDDSLTLKVTANQTASEVHFGIAPN